MADAKTIPILLIYIYFYDLGDALWASKHPVFLEDLSQAFALEQFLPGRIFGIHLRQCRGKSPLGDRLRDDDDPIDVAEHPVARLDMDAAAVHRHVARDHFAAAPRIERPDAPMEQRETHRPDAAHVAHQA